MSQTWFFFALLNGWPLTITWNLRVILFAGYIYLENILEIEILSENILKDSFQRLN